MTYGCCGLESKIDREGITTEYIHDELKRVIAVIRAGITIFTTYDAEGRVVETMRKGSNHSEILTNRSTFDVAGRLTSSRDALDHESRRSFGEGGTILTTINPDGTTRIETFAPDGQLLSVSGTAVHPVSYEYGVDADGRYVKEIRNASSGGGSGTPLMATSAAAGSSRASTKGGKAMAKTKTAKGKKIEPVGTVRNPAVAGGSKAKGGSSAATRSTGATALQASSDSGTPDWTKTYYNLIGQPYKTVTAAGAVTRSYYNLKGQVYKQVDPDGVTTLFQYNDKGELEYTALDMNRNGQIDFAGPDRTIRIQNEVATAHGATVRRTTTTVWTTEGSGVASTVSVNEAGTDGLQNWSTVNGLTSHSQTTYGGSGQRTVVITAPDDTVTTQNYQQGRLISSVTQNSQSGILNSSILSYDGHARPISWTDARGITAATTYNAADQVISTTVSGGGILQTTSFVLDAMGRRTQTTLPDGGVVTYRYLPTGEMESASGTRTYPVQYTFDGQGRLKTMQAGTGTTTWNYAVDSGFLTSKLYADGTGPSYTYTTGGRLQTRAWARGVTTTYSLNNAGEVAGVTYSDSTPAVTYTLDRRGRKVGVSSSLENLAIAYNDAGQPVSETHTGGPLDGAVVSRAYDALLRLSNLQSQISSAAVSQQTFGYDTASRMNLVSDGTRSAEYAYLPNSSLVNGVTFKRGTATVMSTAKQFDGLNRLTSVTHSLPVVSKNLAFDYTLNNANQRTRVDLADGSYWSYEFDSLGQVTSGKKFWSDGTPVAGQQFDYAFDTCGNRTSTTVNGHQAAWTANNLNQVTEREVPGFFDVTGTCSTNATLTINLEPVVRTGEYFHKEIAANNSATAVYTNLWVVGVKNNVGPNGEDAVTEEKGFVFLPQMPERPTWDADGNLTGTGRWLLTWNAENKLIAVESRPEMPAESKRKVEYVRDGQGRVIERKIYTWDQGTSAYSLQSAHLFVYDGRKLLAELKADTKTVLHTYVHGLDLSGTLEGAGGVGGLVAINTANQGSHFYAMDGNGNVAGLVDADIGDFSALYDYEAFGRNLRSTGAMAEVNRFQFSTKPKDPVTGWPMYEERTEIIELAIWGSRDPAGEAGGPNPYLICNNDAVNATDSLGLWSRSNHELMTTLAWGTGVVKPLDMRPYSDDIVRVLIRQNAYVDENLLSNNYWHFNRSVGEDVDVAIAGYNSTLRNTQADIDESLSTPNADNCRKAMNFMGRLTHAYQDYYAHSIRRDSDGSAKTIGRITGSPLLPGPDMKPSSWNSWWWNRGEHGMSEPGDRAPDAAERQAGARDYTAKELEPFANKWWKSCKCYAKEIFNH